MRPGVLGAQSKNSFGSDIQFSSSMYVPSAKMMSLLRDEPPGYRCYKLGTLLDVIRCTKTQMPAVFGWDEESLSHSSTGVFNYLHGFPLQ
jgi:hypothetical protein